MKVNQLLLMACLMALFFASCEKEELAMGEIESIPPVVSFTATPADNPNYIVLDNTSTGDGIFSAWRLSADREFKRDDPAEPDTAYYPEAGMYEITLLVGNDAGFDSLTTIVNVDQRDRDLPDPDSGGSNCLLLADFEDGEVGDWNAWGQDVTVADNPAPSAANASAKVLKMTQTEAFSQNANRSIPIVNEQALKVTVDVYFEVAGSLKLQIEADFGTGFFLDVPAGEWVTLEYDLEGLTAAGTEYPWLLIQGNTAGNFYIDNINYCGNDISVGGGSLLGDFEDGEVGDWNAWGQDVTVVDNPAASAVNTSSKVLKMTQAEAFSQNANRSIPVVTAAAKKITIDVYFEVAGSLKLQIEEDFGTGFFLDVPTGEWVTLTYNLEGEVNDTAVYPWILIQGNTPGSYYIDNITYFE